MVLEFGTWSCSIWDIGFTSLNLEFLGFFLEPEAGISDLMLGFRTWSWYLGPEAGIWDMESESLILEPGIR